MLTSQTSPCSSCSPEAAAAPAALPSAHRRAPASPRRCPGGGGFFPWGLSERGPRFKQLLVQLGRGRSPARSAEVARSALLGGQKSSSRLRGCPGRVPLLLGKAGAASPEAGLPRGAAAPGVPVLGSLPRPVWGSNAMGCPGRAPLASSRGDNPLPEFPLGNGRGGHAASPPAGPGPGPGHSLHTPPTPAISHLHPFPAELGEKPPFFLRWSLTIWPPALSQLCHTQVEPSA